MLNRSRNKTEKPFIPKQLVETYCEQQKIQAHEAASDCEKPKKKESCKNENCYFLTFPVIIPIIFANLNSSCSNASDLRNL